jgi:hypothetical protein
MAGLMDKPLSDADAPGAVATPVIALVTPADKAVSTMSNLRRSPRDMRLLLDLAPGTAIPGSVRATPTRP